MTFSWPWRRWRGLLAALCVLAFVGAAGVDGLVCGGDVAAAAEAVDHDPGPDRHDGDRHDGEAPCEHGHCHHGGAFVPPMTTTADAPRGRRQARGPGLVTAAASDRQFELMRPPRG